MNLVVPLPARQSATWRFRRSTRVGFWLTATGALLVNVSLVVGEFARTGWLPYPPLVRAEPIRRASASTIIYGPCRSPGVGTLVAGINLVTTVLEDPATRGMTYMRMPMFCWTTLASNLLIVAAFPNPDRDGWRC